MGWFFNEFPAFIESRLNVKKISEGRNNTSYYHKMHEWFVNDMRKICNDWHHGNVNGENKWTLCLYEGEFIRFLYVNFNYFTGEFINVEVAYRYGRKNKVKLSPKELKKNRDEETIRLLRQFVKNAKEIGYLI